MMSKGWAEPASSTALARTSATQASAATTEVRVRSVSDGNPVCGSMTWWRGSPPVSHRRRNVVDVATAPSAMPSSTSGSGDHGCSTATVQPSCSGPLPADPDVATEVDADPLGSHRP